MTYERSASLGIEKRHRQTFEREKTPINGEPKIISVLRAHLPYGFLSSDYPALEKNLDVHWLPKPSFGMARVFDIGFTNVREESLRQWLETNDMSPIVIKDMSNGETFFISSCEVPLLTTEFIADSVVRNDMEIVYTPRPMIGFKRDCRLLQVHTTNMFNCYEASGYLLPKRIIRSNFPNAARFNRKKVLDSGKA